MTRPQKEVLMCFLKTESERIAGLFLRKSLAPTDDLFTLCQLVTERYTAQQCNDVLTHTSVPPTSFRYVRFRPSLVNDLTWLDYWQRWLRIHVARLLTLELEKRHDVIQELRNRHKQPL